MTRTLTTMLGCALLLLTFAACGGGSGPEGTWSLDTQSLKDATMAKIPKDKVNDPMVKKGMEASLAMFDKMKVTMILKSDGTCSGTATTPGTAEEKSTGTWKLEEGMVAMTMKDAKGKEETKKFKFDGKTMEAEMMGMKMIFRR